MRAMDGTARTSLAGLGLVSLATVAWSFSGVFTRSLSTDVLTAVAWRSFFGGAFLAASHAATYRGRSWRLFDGIGVDGLAMMAAQVICQACTVGAFYLTSVGDVALIYATAPFLAAGLAWTWLGERPPGRTVMAGLASLGGTLVIMAGSLGGGHLVGDLLALGMTLSFACIIVIPRARPEVPTRAATILSAVATFVLFAPLSSPAHLDARNWCVLAGFGLTNFTIALYLFLAGAKRISAAQAALIATLDIVLSPIWVWIAFGEVPALATLLGGAVNLAAVTWHTFADLRADARKPA